ncbi:MAG: protein translocase subunit SecF [Myxococcota bacterium]|nr:protein translocase subunit SecF [Myxococcota bacterium]
MQWISPDINVDFMGARKKAFMASGVIVSACLLSVAIMGLNQGIDFKGGSAVIVQMDKSSDAERGAQRAKLEEVLTVMVTEETGDATSQVTVQDFSAGVTGEEEADPSNRYLIYMEVTSLITETKHEEVKKSIQEKFGATTRIDLPTEGADTYYLSFETPTDITTRKTELSALFADLGFKRTRVTSDTDRQLDVDFYKQMNLIQEEKRTAGGDAIATDSELTFEEWEATKKAPQLIGRTDRRYTVAVEELRAKVEERLDKEFASGFKGVESATSVSPSVGRDLLNNGLLAVLYAIIGILLYITLRFDFRFAPGAVVALVHDVIITMGLFSIFQIKFSLPIIAALLTIVGYSLNDTIVVLDRVRETFDAYRGRPLTDLLNRAINGTLSRTVLTSFTTLLVITSVLVLGSGQIRDFALALLVGVIVGTYSSIFIASPLVYYMDAYLERRDSARAHEARGGSANAAPA